MEFARFLRETRHWLELDLFLNYQGNSHQEQGPSIWILALPTFLTFRNFVKRQKTFSGNQNHMFFLKTTVSLIHEPERKRWATNHWRSCWPKNLALCHHLLLGIRGNYCQLHLSMALFSDLGGRYTCGICHRWPESKSQMLENVHV